jgi:phosphoglycolate phosphatase-like HAD superfamily hydrolase
MLLFFDIDATLINTSRSGMHSMLDAGRDLYGPSFRVEGIDFAGRLDPLILADLLLHNHQEPTPNALADLRARYRIHLERRLAQPGIGRALPGVLPLLDRLRAMPEITLALLTGNFADTGQMKLRACGIDPDWFPIRVWGDESPHSPPARHHLPPLGLERFHARHNRTLPPHHAVIIGDTPHDVACAKAHGLRSLAVATGSSSFSQLHAAHPDRVVQDLSETDSILAWLTMPASTRTPA